MIKDIILPRFNHARDLNEVRFTLLNNICYAYFEDENEALLFYGKLKQME